MSEAGTMSGSPWLRGLRLCLAFLLPAAVAAFVGALILTFTIFSDLLTTEAYNEPEAFRMNHSGMVFLGTLIGATWGQLATTFIGLPAHVWLMRRRLHSGWAYAAVGVLAGAAFGATFVWASVFGATIPDIADAAWLVTASVAAGAIGGLVFWLIRRPDRDATAPAPPPAAAPAHRTHGQAGDI